MAVITRYFSTTAAGDEDGTSWANRAALFDGSNTWSSIIDDFDHTSNSLLCYIGPGSYTCAEALSSSVTGATAYNPIFFHACDSSGNRLTPPDPDWCSAQPVWNASGMPVITTSSNISTISTGFYGMFRLIKFVATGRSGALILPTAYQTAYDWCIFDNQTESTSSIAVNGNSHINNCVVMCSGASYNYVCAQSGEGLIYNTRIEGNASASSGNRYGIQYSGNSFSRLPNCTIINNPGGGIVHDGTSTVTLTSLRRCIIRNNEAGGIIGNATASQTRLWHISGCMITGNGGYGIDVNNSLPFVTNCRLRDNTSGNFADMGNYPESFGNDVSDGYADEAAADGAEYVNASIGDLRIKVSSPIWGKGYGAGDEIKARHRFYQRLRG